MTPTRLRGLYIRYPRAGCARGNAEAAGGAPLRPHLLETTLAGSGVLRHMEAARPAGHPIELHYVCVESPDLALHRIRTHVASGGHHVPEADARRWFARSQVNLPAAIARSDQARLYDNPNPDPPHREVAVIAGAAWWTAGASSGMDGGGDHSYAAAAPVIQERDARRLPANNSASSRRTFHKMRRLHRFRSK